MSILMQSICIGGFGGLGAIFLGIGIAIPKNWAVYVSIPFFLLCGMFIGWAI